MRKHKEDYDAPLTVYDILRTYFPHKVTAYAHEVRYNLGGTGVTPFTADVMNIIQSIPPGRVMTYGQIAAQAGSPRAARQVVRILHPPAQDDLPMASGVNAKGEIAIGSDEGRSMQRALLESEGVYVNPAGALDLGTYRFQPAQPGQSN